MPGGVAGERSATLTAPMPISPDYCHPHYLISKITSDYDLRSNPTYGNSNSCIEVSAGRIYPEGTRAAQRRNPTPGSRRIYTYHTDTWHSHASPAMRTALVRTLVKTGKICLDKTLGQ